jgi:SNF2 family DNA or RNA helicase
MTAAEPGFDFQQPHDRVATQGAIPIPIDSYLFGSGAEANLSYSDWETEWQAEPAVRVVPVQLRVPSPKYIGFTFPESPAWANSLAAGKQVQTGPSQEAHASEASNREVCSSPRLSGTTRMRPPGDLVKLEDRLYYVLQPPIESLINTTQLRFPFAPFPYQIEGIAFLFPRAAAILADEMGLGKTMQAISAMRMLLLSAELQNVLLVCPKPLVTNWVREFRQWAPEVPLAVIEGDSAKRSWMWTQASVPVKIANYELLVRDREWIESGQTPFDLVVLDEAQRIKNRSSTTSQIARAIPRVRSWALTGTPIENSTEDLVSIFEFLSPGHLRDDMQMRCMGKATRDYILRRTKDQVLTEMPPKMFRDAHLDLTSQQWESYQVAEDEGVIRLSEMGDSLTIQHVFELVLRLKQICNFDPVTGASSKLERLEADLEEVAASGQKAIVFSQWVHALDRITDKLARFRPLHYHGRVPNHKRDAVLEQFRTDQQRQVMLMSYGAGAVGLNLQFCHYVFLFDRWWNPAVEDQAINRAHRLGCQGPVTVTRMTSLNTIEERIHLVLEEKRALFNNLFAETGNQPGLRLSAREIFGLFKLPVPRSRAA